MAGPISAGRISKLQTRPECVSSASKSPCSKSAAILSSCFAVCPAVADLLVGHLAPQANVRNSLVVARDHNFCPFWNHDAFLAARAADPARSRLRIDQFARPTFSNRHGELSQHNHHFEIGWVETLFVGHKHLAEE